MLSAQYMYAITVRLLARTPASFKRPL